ncbi:hypothetical protein [Mucilaginibacter sp. UR6-11]|uniref:hypothetical protein n=1 Tax=Mucilaginibacter sp. UR6-11 TaxID=1435644 RepID=UPI001E524040|nr:hypothetical protein [Mucilaginibacter sp. UR6-11]MCC8425654.1 hypothetical protein [Mucilaginibacter sp. UR6-11]
MKTAKSATTNPTAKKTSTKAREEIKTDFPLSEKDEVKKAEHKLQQGPKSK